MLLFMAVAALVWGSAGVAQADHLSGNGVEAMGPNCAEPLCGKIKNSSSSDDDLWIINNWPPETASGAFLRPGETSSKYFKDTDGVYIPTGCKGVRDWAPDWDGGYWYKFSNLFSETVRFDC
ncbi:hypothetical protein [Saccharothrix lopnurensis]|uniref:Peptidase inhibitor family I36 n=1 Tax=Saccharothrix lopnurensis TaxID=1670621 RepID=A0ABW1P5W8_9PSEU